MPIDKDKIVDQCLLEYEHCLKYRRQREPQWSAVDDMYFGNKKKSLVSRANVHLPVLQGSVETWVSKVDDPPHIEFDPDEEGDRPNAANATGLVRHDARLGYWDLKDLMNKRVAAMKGRAVFKKYSTSNDGFQDHLDVVDPLDFLIDPLAGGLVPFENARYCGQDNIIRTKSELSDDAIYDQPSVDKVVGPLRSDAQADNRHQSLSTRRSALGLSDAVLLSEDSVRLVEWYTTYEGQRYYVLFSPEQKVAIRTSPLKDIFESDEFPFASWAVFPHPFEFWTPGIGELFREVNQVENVLTSQILDNNAYRNYGMKIYDAQKVPNPALLDPKPMGKVAVNGSPKDVVMNVEFPSIVESLQLMGFLNTSFSRDSGISDMAKGMPNSKRMSATESANMVDQVADRFFTVNRTYRECYRRLGELYFQGIVENMTRERRVKVLGAKGFEWRKVTKSDIRGNFTVKVTTDASEKDEGAVEKQSFQLYIQNARQNQRLNQSFLDEKEARMMGFTDDEVTRLLNPDMEGDWVILANAAAENEDMLKADVPPNNGATAGHVQRHLDFARKTNGLKPLIVDRILAHAQSEIAIAAENEMRRAKDEIEKKKLEIQPPAPQPSQNQLPPGAIQQQTTVMPQAMPPVPPMMG